MKKIRSFTLLCTLTLGMVGMLSQPSALAQSSPVQSAQRGLNSISGSADSDKDLNTSITDGINTFFYVIGAVSVLMIIYGGFRYVTSAGENGAVTSAKNTILYAIVGLVVAVMAYAIVNFVIDPLI